MKLDDSDAAARLTAGATEVCCRLAITPISVSDSVASASLRAAIGPRSLINSRILARLFISSECWSGEISRCHSRRFQGSCLLLAINLGGLRTPHRVRAIKGRL